MTNIDAWLVNAATISMNKDSAPGWILAVCVIDEESASIACQGSDSKEIHVKLKVASN
jgi:hypothetical protein